MTYNSAAASKALWAKRLALTAALPALVGAFGWLVGGESSPFHSYFLYHVDWPNRLMSLNLPAYVIAALLSHNVHAPAEWAMWVGFLLQWLPLGFLLSLACVRRKQTRAATA